MVHSDKTKQLIMEFEGCRLEAYKDATGIWTIGFGHTTDVAEGLCITQDRAMELLEEDLHRIDASLSEIEWRHPVTQNMYDAIVSFCFNLGTGAFKGSTLYRYMQKGKYLSAADEFLKWNHAGGKVLSGLTRRRVAERVLFLS